MPNTHIISCSDICREQVRYSPSEETFAAGKNIAHDTIVRPCPEHKIPPREFRSNRHLQRHVQRYRGTLQCQRSKQGRPTGSTLMLITLAKLIRHGAKKNSTLLKLLFDTAGARPMSLVMARSRPLGDTHPAATCGDSAAPERPAPIDRLVRAMPCAAVHAPDHVRPAGLGQDAGRVGGATVPGDATAHGGTQLRSLPPCLCLASSTPRACRDSCRRPTRRLRRRCCCCRTIR